MPVESPRLDASLTHVLMGKYIGVMSPEANTKNYEQALNWMLLNRPKSNGLYEYSDKDERQCGYDKRKDPCGQVV